jgi:hypothetical protein
MYGWPSHLDKLGAIVGDHLGLPSAKIEDVIKTTAHSVA